MKTMKINSVRNFTIESQTKHSVGKRKPGRQTKTSRRRKESQPCVRAKQRPRFHERVLGKVGGHRTIVFGE